MARIVGRIVDGVHPGKANGKHQTEAQQHRASSGYETRGFGAGRPG